MYVYVCICIYIYIYMYVYIYTLYIYTLSPKRCRAMGHSFESSPIVFSFKRSERSVLSMKVIETFKNPI